MMRHNVKRIALVISITFLCVSCSVVPVQKARSPHDIMCGVSSHEYDLKVVRPRNLSASCNSPECILSLGLVAAAWTGVTAVVSGSIVMVGNTVHWLEQLGPCDNDKLEQQINNVNAPLIKQGGKNIRTKAELEEVLEDE